MRKFILLIVVSLISGYTFGQTSRPEIRGYRAMVDLGYNFNANGSNASRIGISTTHGYMFNPNFFIGAGIQMDVLTSPPRWYNHIALPLFVAAKWNILQKKITPFLQGRAGYSIAGNKGHYFSFSAGAQYCLNNGNAIKLSVGAELQQYNITYLDESFHELNNGPFIRVGFEF